MGNIVNSEQLFGLGDGDRIRSLMDRALLDGDLEHVRALSEKLTFAINQLANLIREIRGWHLVFAGGDDICFTIDRSAYRHDHIQNLMRCFNQITGGTMSFGVGPTMESAYLNLSRAKSRGPGVLVATDV